MGGVPLFIIPGSGVARGPQGTGRLRNIRHEIDFEQSMESQRNRGVKECTSYRYIDMNTTLLRPVANRQPVGEVQHGD